MLPVLLLAIYQFLYGFLVFFKSPIHTFKILCNKPVLVKYSKVIALNSGIFLLNYVLLYIINFVNYYLQDYYLHYFINLLYYVLAIPIYIVAYIVSFDYLNYIVNSFKITKKNRNEDIINILYLTLVSMVFYINATLIYYIPYIGSYLGAFSFAFSYGYFCLEYACNLKSLTSKEKLTIIENNPYFFTGYGMFFGILCNYVSIPLFQLIFTSLFPMCILNLVNLDIFALERHKQVKSIIFIIPIFITNIILSLFDSYIINRNEKLIS